MRILMVLAVLLGVVAPARAADDVAAAQAVINAQTEAFVRDDAAAAYAFATPEIQDLFSEADAFMAMVRKAYPPILRHRSFDYGEGRALDGKVVQQVRIVDADGVSWDALYTLERQADGGLRITGCVLLKAPGQAI